MPGSQVKEIAHMPGAGGNFLTRVFAQSHSATPIVPAQYPAEYATGRRYPHPTRWNWLSFERQWDKERQHHGYRHGHPVDPQHSPWLRVTVTTRAEWDWACVNALWKSSVQARHFLASDPDLPAEHYIPLRALWTWAALAPVLAHIQTRPVNAHQHTLWQQWQGTWCPSPEQLPALHQRSVDINEHLRPQYCQ